MDHSLTGPLLSHETIRRPRKSIWKKATVLALFIALFGAFVVVLLRTTVLGKAADDSLATKLWRSIHPSKGQLKTVSGLIARTLGDDFVSKFQLELMDAKTDTEVFEIETVNSVVVLRGTTTVAVASALHWYLKYYCNSHISWSANRIAIPSPLPIVSPKLVKSSPVKFKYYQNVCTVSYSMVWWDWSRWEQEIDWMALQGVNMPLAFTGQEYIWQKVYNEMGISNEELGKFFGGPAFLAWARMGNIKGWGGPLSQSFIDGQAVLQKQILARMRAYGMVPVLPAFNGFVPEALSRVYPNASITRGSRWNSFGDEYTRVEILNAEDPLFQQIGSRFIAEQTKEYGSDHVYNTDTFNENSPPTSDPSYLKGLGAAVYNSMASADPHAIWLMQGWLFFDSAQYWQLPQIEGLLSGVPDDKMIILDLFSDVYPEYKRANYYFGKAFIWCMLHDFGGNVGMYGRLPLINQAVFEALHDPSSQMIGIGLTPEGIEQNPVAYEFMMELGWRVEPVDLPEWISSYVKRRYGDLTPEIDHAWQLLLSTVYNNTNGDKSVTKSVAEIRPEVVYDRDTFMPIRLYYDPKVLVDAWRLFVQSADTQFASTATFQYDLVDVSRQVLSNAMLLLHDEVVGSFNRSDVEGIKRAGSKMIAALTHMDAILATNTHFLLGRWLEAAKSWATTEEEKTQMEFNARNQITLWGPKGEILDYSSRQWSGLVSSFYLPRWKLFIDTLLSKAVAKQPFDSTEYNEQAYQAEWAWCNQHDRYPTTPTGDSLSIAQQLVDIYS